MDNKKKFVRGVVIEPGWRLDRGGNPIPERRRDFTGMVFGKLKVLRRADNDYYYGKRLERREPKWVCQCSCENHTIIEVVEHNLYNGHTTCCEYCRGESHTIDETGNRYGRLTVLYKDMSRRFTDRGAYWICKCDCGNIISVSGVNLRSGQTSCGCISVEKHTKHGMHGTRLYTIYRNMIKRCHGKTVNPNYGGRGISVCDEWRDPDTGFISFYNWAMSHGYDDSLTIDRIDNDGNYEPGNCRFADDITQANNRSSNVYIEYNGETHTLAEWSRILDIPYSRLSYRYSNGWDTQRMFESRVNPRYHIVTNKYGETHTLAEWSVITGLSYELLYDRIFMKNWDVDKALYTPPCYNNKKEE